LERDIGSLYLEQIEQLSRKLTDLGRCFAAKPNAGGDASPSDYAKYRTDNRELLTGT